MMARSKKCAQKNTRPEGNKEGYLTLRAACSTEYTVQRSRFVACAAAVATHQDAEAFIKNIRQRHSKATHCCWAYRVGYPDAPQEHSSDAGEPSGTAGRPIAAAISQAKLQNVCMVVCRYFGGTKLGIRGLIEAYSAASRLALANGSTIMQYPMKTYGLALPYAKFDIIRRTVESLGGNLSEVSFREMVQCFAHMPRSKAALLLEAVRAAHACCEECE